MSMKAGQVAWNKEVALERIRALLDREGPLLPILHALQEAFGHVPEEAVPLVAQALNLSRAACREFALTHSWENSARQFIAHVGRVAVPANADTRQPRGMMEKSAVSEAPL